MRQNGHVLVEDLGSSNGARINGERISGQSAVKDGDLIQIGDYDLALQSDAQEGISTQRLRPSTPLGITRRTWARSSSAEVLTGGMLRLRTRDLAKLGRLLLDRGRWSGKQQVPAAWIDRSLSVQRRPNKAQDPAGQLGYGYLLYRRDYATPCGPKSGWYMSGNGGNHVVVLKDLDAVVVVTRTNYNTRGTHDQTWRLTEQHLLPRLTCPTKR
jgi:CubicO group peptidase (beta-lactamase class C family)